MKNQSAPTAALGSTAHLDALAAEERRIESDRIAAIAKVTEQRRAALAIRQPLSELREKRKLLQDRIEQLETNLRFVAAKSAEAREGLEVAAENPQLAWGFGTIFVRLDEDPVLDRAERVLPVIERRLAERRAEVAQLDDAVRTYVQKHGLEP